MNINIRLWYTRFKYSIDTKYLILLVLAGLHYEKKISDDKLKGQFSSLRKGDLLKIKGTYNCKITNMWYNQEYPYDIFLDCLDMKGVTSIPFKKLIEYIQLFENKNYNYAINVFGSEYLYCIFNTWNPEYYGQDFSNFCDFYIPGIRGISISHSCYECGHEHSTFDKNSSSNLKTISEWLHKHKKGNLKKIPLYIIDKSQKSLW